QCRDHTPLSGTSRRSTAPAAAVAVLRGDRRTRPVLVGRGAQPHRMPRDRRARLQGERRRGNQGEDHRRSGARSSRHNGEATAGRARRSGGHRGGGARLARRVTLPCRGKEGVMKIRLAAMIILAALAAAASSAAHAQLNIFGGYWENVARAARQNDAALVRSLVANDGNPNQTDEEARTG